MIRIRLAKDTDYAAIARMHRSTIRVVNAKDYPTKTIRAWSGMAKASRLRSSASRAKRWVATNNGQIVGFCDHYLNTCSVRALYVHKSYQGKGVGAKLLATVEASLKRSGCKIMKIESTITARPFYASQGYKTIRRKQTSFREMSTIKIPVYVMRKSVR